MTPSLFASQTGLPSVRFGAEALEDPIDPIEGARAFVSPSQLSEGDHVVVFGAGLGYRLERLGELGCEAPIVFEPCPRVLTLAESNGPGVPPGAKVFTSPSDLHQHLLSASKPDQNTLLLCAPPYKRAFPDAFRMISALIDEVQGLVILRRNSVAERAGPMTEQAVQNLPRLATVSATTELGRPLDGFPAFVVSAGPSLDHNRAQLAEAAKRGPVFAVNTSAPALAAIGAPIDVLVSIEMLDVSAPMSRATEVTRALALDVTSGGANYDVDVPRKLVFCADSAQYRQLADRLGIGTLGYGGSVATAAFALAAQLGADPIVLVGQDLAYTGGRGYASDTLFEETEVRREGRHLVIERVAAWEDMTRAGGLRVPSKVRPCVDVPAWGGGTVESTHELTLFRRWFEMAARRLRGLVRLINATEGGASIEGFEELPLAEVIAALPEREHPLHAAIEAAPPIGPARTRAAARAIEEESRRLAGAAKRCLDAVRRRDARALARATEKLSAAAAQAPLAEAHAASDLMRIMDDDTLSPLQRELDTYEVIRSSAQRIARLAQGRGGARRFSVRSTPTR